MGEAASTDNAYPIRRQTTIIGRGKDTDLLLPDISVSRHHAKITMDNEDTYILHDIKERQGVGQLQE